MAETTQNATAQAEPADAVAYLEQAVKWPAMLQKLAGGYGFAADTPTKQQQLIALAQQLEQAYYSGQLKTAQAYDEGDPLYAAALHGMQVQQSGDPHQLKQAEAAWLQQEAAALVEREPAAIQAAQMYQNYMASLAAS